MERDLSGQRFPLTVLISIHALRMERDAKAQRHPVDLRISIHALRMERDGAIDSRPLLMVNFNPRAPHGARQNRP